MATQSYVSSQLSGSSNDDARKCGGSLGCITTVAGDTVVFIVAVVFVAGAVFLGKSPHPVADLAACG